MKKVPDDISPELQNAILNRPSSTMVVRTTVDPSRTYFESPDSTYSYNGSSPEYDTPSDDPVGQCVLYSPYMSKLYTFIIDKASGVIYAMESGFATKNNLSLTADPDTKPSAIDLGNGSARLYYWDGTLKYSNINLSSFTPSGTTSVPMFSSPNWTVVSGSPTAMDIDHLVLCYKTSLGGISVAYKEGSHWWTWNQRFMSANCLTDAAWTIYTTAAMFNGKVYVYSTDINEGTVRAVEHDPYASSWSDIFVALPADFSRFDIANAVVANGYVHLAGQFHRTDEHSEARVYSLVLRSPDGRSFSWDKFTLLSSNGFRFHIALDNTNKKVYASDRNSVGYADMSYYFTNSPNGRVVLEPPNSTVSFRADNQSATIQVSNAKEEYTVNQTIKRNNRARVEVGYLTELGTDGS